jgi:hypothetical protein
LELARVEVKQFPFERRNVFIDFHPKLPDVRRRFEGRHTSRWEAFVEGKHHAVGEIVVWWEDDGPRAELVGAWPDWVTEPPMRTQIDFDDGAHIRITRGL